MQMDVRKLVLTLLFLELGAGLQSLKFKELNKQYYTDVWVVQLLTVDPQVTLLAIAESYGFAVLGQVGTLNGYYGLKLLDASLHKRALESHDGQLESVTRSLQEELQVGYVAQQMTKEHVHRDYSYPIDPQFSQQWSIVNSGQTRGVLGRDLNVEPVWLQGVTGQGVVVSVVDDGLEVKHPDINRNYDQTASWDFAFEDNDPTPSIYYGDEADSHGTECAGEIAMVKDNGQCGVGVAYNCSIGGIKFDLSTSSDAIESRMFSYKNNYIQVYSNSWGPGDYGFIVGEPEPLAGMALENAVTKGRNGKGAIVVFASGNGGIFYDSCAADGYTSSVYTIGVGSADQNGRAADYDEECSGKMATTFSYNSDTFPSDGSYTPYNQITTTSLNGECVEDFTGTSSSAPLVSGSIALLLQANQNLTWRDVQYLLVYTSDRSKLIEGDWSMNGAGIMVSHKFGFGAVNVEALVTRGRNWVSVPERQRIVVLTHTPTREVRSGSPLSLDFNVTEDDIHFLEHVVLQATLTVVHPGSRSYGLSDYTNFLDTRPENEEEIEAWLQRPHPRRGDISIQLLSPQGTVSVLLPKRKYDFINDEGYDSWPFMSVHHWGEDPVGLWTATVDFVSSSGYVTVSDLEMTLYGTASTPESAAQVSCSEACEGGCYGPASSQCDTCRDLRVVSTLDCVTECPNDTFTYKKYCTSSRIDIPVHVDGYAAVIGGSVGGVLCLVVVVFLVVGCSCWYFIRRKKVERSVRPRYRVLSAEEPHSVAV